MPPDFDIVIVGGGLTGASLAYALGGSTLRIAVIESAPVGELKPADPEGRTVALNYGSRRIFDALGVWDDIRALGVTPIERIHISDRGRFGATRLDARSMQVDALGFVVEARRLGQALQRAMRKHANITLIAPARLQALTVGDTEVTVTLNGDAGLAPLTARLVVGADGAHSAVRAAAGIEARVTDYGQTAIVSSVTAGLPHANTAYERFTESGPLALLPRPANRLAVVWTARAEDSDSLMALSDAEFLQGLQERFGMRLGRLSAPGRRQLHTLALTRAAEHVRPRVALIGNAAHTLHPVAGQGFNLGLRDAAALAQVIVDSARGGNDIGAPDVLESFAGWVARDDRRVTAFTNGLVRVFSNDFAPLGIARGLGLTLVDLAPPVKRALLRRTMGLAGRLPRLACGLPL